MPRLPQRLIRRYAIQSVHVLQAATDQRANQTADGTADGTADTGRAAYCALRRLVAAAIGLIAATFVRAVRRGRWRRRGFLFIFIWHVSIS